MGIMNLFSKKKLNNDTSKRSNFFENNELSQDYVVIENQISYINLPSESLSDDQLKQCSDLFSNNYGKYSSNSQIRPGKQVHMGIEYYRKNYSKPEFSVALALFDNRIVGQAFYLRKKYEDIGIMTWIVQLVVDSEYRQRGIASTLLRSIWGFSDDFAWGLATANPCTVKTLESATMRKCKPKIISRHIKDIRKIGDDIEFVKDSEFEVSSSQSQINSGFDVDNSGFKGIKEYEKRLGALKPGREWLAFTFFDQGIQSDWYKKNFHKIIEFSEKQLQDAYSRMPIESQKWAQGEKAEIDYILTHVGKVNSAIDLGCGIGRHTIELASRNIRAIGVDYSERHIEYAKKKSDKRGCINISFEKADLREYTANDKYDLAICLYDVIGSYPDQDNNARIIRTAYRVLKDDGYLVLSVMNMELTESIVPDSQKGDIEKNADILLKLSPAQIMQSTGNVFSSKHMAIDTKTGLVYRKEQFAGDMKLPAEYVIRDKRYTMKEIVAIIEAEGFVVEINRYVQAGHFNKALKSLDKHAKEILIVAKKPHQEV